MLVHAWKCAIILVQAYNAAWLLYCVCAAEMCFTGRWFQCRIECLWSKAACIAMSHSTTPWTLTNTHMFVGKMHCIVCGLIAMHVLVLLAMRCMSLIAMRCMFWCHGPCYRAQAAMVEWDVIECCEMSVFNCVASICKAYTCLVFIRFSFGACMLSVCVVLDND